MKHWNQKHLAWHETLELHELVAFQSTQLIGFKKKLPMIKNQSLRALFIESIQCIEQNLHELLQFYPSSWSMERHLGSPDMTAVESGSLLGFSKAAVRNYAGAITETATPQLRETFKRHLFKAIELHGKVFYFMFYNGYYPAYDLEQLLANDVKMAKNALAFR